jgi:hypothetical protein
MTTKRTPIARPQRSRITPVAVAAFVAMEDATTDEERNDAHSALHDALGLKPWEWPAIEHPDSVCPYPAGSAAARHWPEAMKLYEALKEAAQ